jgi:hypothetical protein
MNRQIFLNLTFFALSYFISPSANAQFVTDAVLFRSDASGSSIGQGWNTRGSDWVYNLYLLSGNTFINSGDSSSTFINLDLSHPGDYTFGIIADNSAGSTGVTNLGLNLFFDNNSNTPRISVKGSQEGIFTVNTSSNTPTPGFGSVPSANTLSYHIGQEIITLTNFDFKTTLSTIDRVSYLNNIPNGQKDTVGSFMLSVKSTNPTHVPEPSSLFGLGAIAILGLLSKLSTKPKSRTDNTEETNI